ncbi:MAG: 16S rRNA (guanine(527)-N(7))-methyltransferase RsmG [Polyangiaceae bacterium]|jgi:16S rRNA (guanine527-N7)-methyltransferase|nr:16S rRNA (guanine(527)-N(7))-methyltransferase RsmG [Polyangiaceae bacterium]
MPQPSRPRLPIPDSAPLAVPCGFAAQLRALHVHLDPRVLDVIGDYLGRLLAMNQQMNLTAIVDPQQAWEKHALDAMSLLPHLAALGAGARLADVGSGGGVPGMILAAARPDLKITLIEATQKKAAFLEGVAAALGLTQVTVRAARVETLHGGELGGSFDVVTARAVAKLVVLVPLLAPLVRPAGRMLLIKGRRADEELAAARAAMAKHGTSHEATVQTPTGRIVVLRRSARP